MRRGQAASRVCERSEEPRESGVELAVEPARTPERAVDTRRQGGENPLRRRATRRAADEPHTCTIMPAAPYIPAKDADFDAWLLNFTTLLTAAPITYGLTAPDAVTCAAQYTAWHPAYLAATDPGTRTPVTVAAKDAARVTAEQVIRPYAQEISKNAAVATGDKVAIGVNLPNNSPVPIPPPVTFPQLSFRSAEPLVHILQWQDSGLGTGKQKPFGAIGCELYRAVGTVPAVDPLQAVYSGTFTKSPLRSTFEPTQVGKLCTYFARWITRSGPGGVAQVGPWSAPLTVSII